MKSTGFLSTLGVGICAVFLAIFLLIPYSELLATKFAYFLYLLYPDEIVGGWFSLPNDWRATETVKAFFDSFNTSYLPMNRLSVLLIAAIESLWIYSLGSLIFRLLNNPLQDESPALQFCMECLTGAAALSAMTGILGLLGCLHGWLFWTLAAGMIIAKFGMRNAELRKAHQISCELRDASCEKATNDNNSEGLASTPHSSLLTPNSIIIFVALTLLCLLAVLPAMSPPWEFDVREYHLESVKEFWLSGRITALPNNAYANMPLGVESLVLAAMSLSGDWFLGALAGKTVLSLFVPLTAILLYALGEKYLSKRAGLIAALVYVSAPLVIRNAQFGLIDNVLAAYALATAAVVCLELGSCENIKATNGSEFEQSRGSADWERRLAASLITLLGVMAGMAAAIKYPGALFVALPCFAVVLWQSCRTRRFLPVATFLLAAVLVGGIWYLKNAILLGNPVYPLCSNLFGSEFPAGFSAESYARWQTVHAPHGWSWSAIVTPITGFFITSSDASPLILPALVLGTLFWNRIPKQARWSLIYCGLFIVGWLALTHRIERFLLPVVPFIAFAGGAAFDALLSSSSVWLGRLLKGVLAFSVGYSCLILALPTPGGMLGAMEDVSVMRSSPLRLGEGLTQLVTLKSEELLKMKDVNKRVLLIGDAAVFDFPIPVEYAVCFNSDNLLDDVTNKFKTNELPQTVVVNLSELARYQNTEYGYSSKIKAVLELLERSDQLEPIYRSEAIIIYQQR